MCLNISVVKEWTIRYDRLLGQGTWSRVYLATHPSKGEAAVKIVEKLRLKYHEKDIAKKEIEMFIKLKDVKGVLRLYDYHEDSLCWYMFLEFCPNGDLFDYVAIARKLPESEAKHILKQLSTTLCEIHRHGVLHRDLKLENILIRSDYSMAIADFGLSTNVTSTKQLVSQWVGSPEYASPELVGKISYNSEVDIWALGVIAYAMTVGQVPFVADNIQQLFQLIQTHTISYPDTMSTNLRNLLESMLDRDVTKRLSIDAVLKHPFLAVDIPQQSFSSSTSSPPTHSTKKRRRTSETHTSKYKPCIERHQQVKGCKNE